MGAIIFQGLRYLALLLFSFIVKSQAQAEILIKSDPSYSLYKAYLPAPVFEQALAGLVLAVQQHTLAAMSQTIPIFQSAESSAASLTPITNQVSFTRHGVLEVWLMRQKQFVSEGIDPTYWSFIAIIVNKAESPMKAYFLEFKPNPVAAGFLPIPIAPRMACYRCHANGPRVIRIEKQALLAPLTVSQRNLIHSWNERIRNSGVITYFEPKTHKLSDLRPAANAILPFSFCRDCHSASSAVRSELKRQHFGSIDFMLTHATDVLGHSIALNRADPTLKPTMPPEIGLTKQEQKCLDQWLHEKPLEAICAEMVSKDAVGTQSPAIAKDKAAFKDNEPFPELNIDAERSSLTLEVSTNLSQFKIDGSRVSGTLDWLNCKSSLKLDLSGLNSGNRLRDKHLSTQVLLNHTLAGIRLSQVGCNQLRRAAKQNLELEIPIIIEFYGKTRAVPLKIQFFRGSASIEAPLILTDFGIDPPSLFGLRVNPRVKVMGSIYFL